MYRIVYSRIFVIICFALISSSVNNVGLFIWDIVKEFHLLEDASIKNYLFLLGIFYFVLIKFVASQKLALTYTQKRMRLTLVS